jgi:HEAT repeat protein
MSVGGKARLAVFCAALAAAAAAALFLLGHFGKRRQVAAEPAARQERATKPKTSVQARVDKGHAHAPTGRVARASAGATNRVERAPAEPRTEDERKASAMRELLDSGDQRAALQAARELMASPEEAVRSSVVTVLGWIGLKALPELTQMLGDASEVIAEDALTQWKMAFGEIQDDAAKAELLVAALQTMQDAEEQEMLVMNFSQMQEGLAIRSLSQIIQGDNETAAEAARSHYEFMVGEPYTTPDAALVAAAQKDREDAAPE